MKRVALVALVLAGCPAIEVPQGRYRCDATGNREVGSAQCPGTSRCGLEGYCHDVSDTSVRWKCEAASDCEQGWLCGIAVDGESRECHDPAAPEDFRCVTSADCSGAWTCGLDIARLRRCHDPANPKAWPCESVADCVGGWQCGVAATGGRECHDPARPEAWTCLSNADCLGGWQCGLNDLRTGRECHDPQAPRGFACEFATDCLGQWSCGLNDARTARECHDPSAPRAYSCQSLADCVGGWSCGLNDARTARECHDPAAPRAFACVVPTDCIAGWQCGLAANRLQRECHDPSNPQAFACDSDVDCLAGWRCDIDGLCVNPRNDALEPVAPLDGGPAIFLSPLDTIEFTQLAVSPVHRTSDKREVLTVATVRGGTLEVLSKDEATPLRRWSTGFSPRGPVISPGARWVRDTPFDQERVETPLVCAISPDGGLMGFELLPDGGTRGSAIYDSTNPQLPPLTDLRHGLSVIRVDGGSPRGADLPYLLGFSARPDRYVVFDGLGDRAAVRDIVTSPGFPLINRAGNQLVDLTDLYFESVSGASYEDLECTYLVDSSGLWINQSDSSFDPLHAAGFGNAACGRTGLKVERFSLADTRRAVVVAAPWDGGQRQVAVWNLERTFPLTNQSRTGTWCADPLDPCSPLPWATPGIDLGPCLPCPTGELVDATPVDVPGRPLELDARCGSRDGGASTFYRVAPNPLASGSCTIRLLTGSSGLLSQPRLVVAEQPSMQRVAFGGPNGQLWLGPSAQATIGIAFDRVPIGIMRTGFGTPLLVADGVIGAFSEGFGFVGSSRATPSAVAQNEPSWALREDLLWSFAAASSFENGRPLAVAVRQLPAPQLLLRVESSALGPVAVVAAGNQVWTAVVDDTSVPPRSPAQLAPRLSTVGQIGSIAVSASLDGGAGFVGYATTVFGLSRLVGDASGVSWRAEEVLLSSTSTAREVWFSKGRARVGLDTGAVLSLPSRVPIAPPLAQPVEDYAQGCGRQLALTRSGLYELEAVAATPMGRWRPVTLPPLPGASSYADGRLFVLDDQLFISSREGELTRLSLAPCVP